MRPVQRCQHSATTQWWIILQLKFDPHSFLQAIKQLLQGHIKHTLQFFALNFIPKFLDEHEAALHNLNDRLESEVESRESSNKALEDTIAKTDQQVTTKYSIS